MKKFFLIFVSLTLSVNIFISPIISKKSSDRALKRFINSIFKEKLRLEVFENIVHSNTALLLTMYDIRYEFFELFDDQLKFRFVPIAAVCLSKFFDKNKKGIDLKSRSITPTMEDTKRLDLIMKEERESLADSSNELDKKLFYLRSEFIVLIEEIRVKFGVETASYTLSKFEFDEEKRNSQEKLKEETFLKLAEVLIGFKSDERKVIEIERLNENISYLKSVLNPSI